MARAVLRMLPDGRLPPPDLQTLAALAQEWGPFLQELLPGIALTGEGSADRAAGQSVHLCRGVAVWLAVPAVQRGPAIGRDLCIHYQRLVEGQDSSCTDSRCVPMLPTGGVPLKQLLTGY